MSKIFKQVFRPSTTQKDGAYFTSSDDRLWLKSGRKVEAALEGVGCGLITSQWNLDKTAIAEALTLQGVPTLATESGEAMARKILDLQIAVPSDPSLTPPPTSAFDPWTILYNNQRSEYKGMYMVTWGNEPQRALENADAYLTSDGKFYTSNVVHVWDTSVVDRWVIYYTISGELVLSFNSNHAGLIHGIYVYKGKPIVVSINTTVIDFIVADTVDPYVLDESGITGAAFAGGYAIRWVDDACTSIKRTIRMNTGSKVLNLNKLETIDGPCSFWYDATPSYLSTITFPKLKEITSNQTAPLIYNSAFTGSLRLPSLEINTGTNYIASVTRLMNELYVPELRISTGIASTNDTIEELNFPKLEEIHATPNATVAINAFSKLRKLNLPELTSTTGGIFGNCPNLVELNAPKLTTIQSHITNGSYVFGNTGMSILNLPSVKIARNGIVTGSGIEHLIMDNLEIIERSLASGYKAIFNSPTIKTISFKGLKSWSGHLTTDTASYAALNNLPLLEELYLDSIETINVPLIYNCPNLKYLYLPATDNVDGTAFIHPYVFHTSNIETLELGQGFRKNLDLRYWTTFKDDFTIITYIFNRIGDTGRAMTLTISTAIRDAVGVQAITDLTTRTGITVTVV